MAKFFLFVFTILLSLSLGLFVGQNYILNDTSSTALSKQDESPKTSLLLELEETLKALKNKFFANEEIIPLEKEEFDDQQFADLKPEAEAPALESEGQNPDTSKIEEPKIQDLKPTEVAESKPAETPKSEPKLKTTFETKPVVTDTKTTDASEDWPLDPKTPGWVIQVSAFRDLSDASKVEEKVKAAGFPTYTYKTKLNNQTWYRINVGPFESVTEATNFKQSQKVHIKFKGAFVRKL